MNRLDKTLLITVLLQTYDLDALLESRSSWGLFRDRRPEYYGAITHRAQDSLTR